MKKMISLLLAMVMVITMIPMTGLAVETENLTIAFETDFTNDLAVGDTFTVTGILSNNEMFGAMCLTLKWNDKAVKFTGFDVDRRGALITEVFIYNAAVVNQELGTMNAVDAYGYDTNGVLFTANFEIVGDGELGIGLKTDSASEYMIRNLEGTADIPATIDTSALDGRTVGGKAVGPEMPEDAPFTAITTDAGPVIAAPDMKGYVGYSAYGTAPHYHITIPENATMVKVTHSADAGVFYNSDSSQGSTGVYGYLDDIPYKTSTTATYELVGVSENGDVTVGFPLEIAIDSDWDGTIDEYLDIVSESSDEIVYIVTAEDTGFYPICYFSFAYADESDEEEIYNIHVAEGIVGGTVWAEDEDGNRISTAKPGDTVMLKYEEQEGYTYQGFSYVNEDTNQEIECQNGAFNMPWSNVTIKAAFKQSHAHAYEKEVVADKYLKDAATCKSGAVYYKSCECGEFVTTADTFVSGDPVTHHYVDGKCEWCQLAEVVGYRFATSADVSAENGGTAVVHVKITGHSNPAITSYNAYDLTLTFDSDKLEYQGYDGAVKSDNGSVTVEGNTIRIVGCGADKDFGTEIAALTFKTKDEGTANVTIDKVQVSDKEESVKEDAPEATPKHDEEDTDADETPDVSIIVVPYSVTKPDFISGNDKILHGEDYTFSYTDTTNYTYSDLIVKVGGEEVTPVEENGVYTIYGVTGAIEITATQTANSYDVTKPENVAGPDKATYGEDYIFTVTPSKEDMAIDTVAVKYADGSEVPYTINENGEYVIDGTSITGAFTITVTEKKDMTTIKFEGIEETEIEGGKLIVAAKIGETFSFKLIKDEKFDYIAKIGDTELTVDEKGNYIIPAELVGENEVIVKIEKVDNTTATVDVVEYINLDGKTMFLVTAKWRDKVLAYGEEGTMFWSDKYTVTGEEEAGAYCWLVVSTDEMNTVDLVKAAAEAAIVEAAEGATATVIKYNFDINGTTKVDVNDAQLAYDMYNASYMEFTENLPMLKFLEADMQTDAKLDTQDVAAIISYIVSGANA